MALLDQSCNPKFAPLVRSELEVSFSITFKTSDIRVSLDGPAFYLKSTPSESYFLIA